MILTLFKVLSHFGKPVQRSHADLQKPAKCESRIPHAMASHNEDSLGNAHSTDAILTAQAASAAFLLTDADIMDYDEDRSRVNLKVKIQMCPASLWLQACSPA